jgi:hypothetical protein
MRGKSSVAIFCAFVLCLTHVFAWADPSQFPENSTFTTVITTPRSIEGLTGDGSGNLYTGGSGTTPCPVWKINLANPSLIPVGFIPSSLAASCGFSGITFNDVGDLFVADGGAGSIYTFTPNASNPPNATIFASGIPGTNGLAFDRDGNLWTGDGTTGQGRVWKITGSGANCAPASIVNCQEVFRIQPMANEINLVAALAEWAVMCAPCRPARLTSRLRRGTPPIPLALSRSSPTASPSIPKETCLLSILLAEPFGRFNWTGKETSRVRSAVTLHSRQTRSA